MTEKNTLNLDAIAQAKAKLAEELRKLEAQEVELRQQEATDAFSNVIKLLQTYGSHFNAKQKAEIAALTGAGEPRARKSAGSSTRGTTVAPKYWLPHTGETWTGRGRTPKAFAAWEGTAAYNEWKARHPKDKFPAYPG
ncbi:H-NS family nucleoid-associated regulatory protein [Pseudoxanthomonas sp. X-1]|uniref:H-NS histone family protein n=1 Tax=Pseudoxanthomonas sp. X-1 TaxID=2571115 RepID=UPI00110B7FED|nr:H-NS family nucleoid-associated regulatory protein [Pseudoxanthomonas sp. X-1]TMN25787.1 histone-like nucleoid-structuring protein [Pseudoxanthomonas sp. X-1]UAY72954.1 H-NS histone family protein [Pseudoxanthomonas sp. X-1]